MKPCRFSVAVVLAFALALVLGSASTSSAALRGEDEIVATFSIVAHDPETGAFGCAVQSRYFAVGAVVPWAEADVGVIATQANVNVGYGPRGMELLRQGLSAKEVLKKLQDEDTFPGKDGRQVAIIDRNGEIAAYTGPAANAWAGDKQGANYSVQGNILTGPEVVDQMASAFEKTKGTLAERLVAALEAAQEAGGDSRGRQSAALLVVQKGAGRNINNDVAVRLHVDDNPEPIQELRRLLNIQLALGAISTSRQNAREGKSAEAIADAERATKLWPKSPDAYLNLGLLRYDAGDKDRALAALLEAKALNPKFRGQLEGTLKFTGHAPLDEAFLKKLFPESR
jgi:uncharacterized Ntn-hydrolase superfamily protein